MKNKKLVHALVLSSLLAGSAMHLAQAQTADAPMPLFDVQQIELTGQLSLLTERTLGELLAQLRQYKGKKMTQVDLAQLVQNTQKWLDAKLPGRFVLSIPAQTLSNGNLSMLVQPKLVDVKVVGAQGFDEANVRASLPSLTKGMALESQSWVDVRELQMANENPLKLTTVDYAVQPDNGVSAKVKATAPLGNTQGTVGVNNTGNDISGRGQFQVNAVNANLTGEDDVLNFAAGGSLDPFAKSNYASLRYSMPDYAEHVSRTVEYTHSTGNLNFPFLSLGTIGAKGVYNDLSYRQAYYLGDVAQTLDASKLTLGVSMTSNESKTDFLGTTLSEYKVKTVPLSVAFEGDFKITQPDQAHARVEWLGSNASWGGGDQSTQWDAARSGVDKRYNVMRMGLNGRVSLDSQASFSWQYRGQYTSQKLLPVLQFSAINAFTGVRGFVNATGLGDTGHVLRLDLESGRMLDDADVRGYGFYDAGSKKGGSDELDIHVASAGLGARWTSTDRLMKLDVFAAKKLKGYEYDLVSNTSTQKSKSSLWFLSSYSF